MIPLYFFYNWFRDTPNAKELGVTYTYAEKIKELMENNPKTFKKRKLVHPLTKPMKELFCTNGSIIDEILRTLGENPETSSYVHIRYPNYIQKKFEQGKNMIRVRARAEVPVLSQSLSGVTHIPNEAKFHLFTNIRID